MGSVHKTVVRLHLCVHLPLSQYVRVQLFNRKGGGLGGGGGFGVKIKMSDKDIINHID
jgi:hypothetical protein